MTKGYENIDVTVFLTSLMRFLPTPHKKTDLYFATEHGEGERTKGEEACSFFVPSPPEVPKFPSFALNKVGAYNANRLHRTLLSFVSAFLWFLSLTFCRTR